MKTARIIVLLLVALTMLLAACAPATTVAPTTVPATKAPEATKPPAPTNTAVPPTATAVPPTATKPAATATAIPNTPTATPIPKCDLMANPPKVAAGALGSPDKPLTITFVPSGDTGKITKAGTAIAECLSKMTGLTFKIDVGTSFAASIEAMGAGKAQISFLNTVSAILAAQKYGVQPVVLALRKYSTNDVDPDKADKDKLLPYYKGQFIASVKSGIKDFADLKGKTFCFVDPTSTSGYILPSIVLRGKGINPDKDFKAVINAGSHDKVAIGVYNGDCDAGVTYVNVLTDTTANLAAKYPDILDKVKPFAVTDKIPNDGMQVSKDLPVEIKDAVVASMLAMSKDPGGISMLTSLYNYNALEKVDSSVYDVFVKALKDSGFDLGTLIK